LRYRDEFGHCVPVGRRERWLTPLKAGSSALDNAAVGEVMP